MSINTLNIRNKYLIVTRDAGESTESFNYINKDQIVNNSYSKSDGSLQLVSNNGHTLNFNGVSIEDAKTALDAIYSDGSHDFTISEPPAESDGASGSEDPPTPPNEVPPNEVPPNEGEGSQGAVNPGKTKPENK